MMRSLTLLLMLSLIGLTSRAQQINRAEYFIDTDNGVGTGTPITITTAGNQVNQSFTIPVNSISQGFHRLGVRCRNTNGTWSQQITSLFYILPSTEVTASVNINRAEYFIDSDPGLGAGTPITITSPGASINQNIAINIGALIQGFHRLVVRVRNINGTWSQQLSSLFYVLPAAPTLANSTITLAEYFIDSDPGVGNGTLIPAFTAGASVSSAFSVPVNTLSQGFHRLNVRVKDGAGKWSHQFSSLFYVLPNAPTAQQQQIVAAEWFVDADPGIGNGTPITNFTPGNNVNVLSDISVASLNLIDPNHTLSIRVKDQTGKWSLHLTAPFQICQPTSTANFTFSAPCPNQPVLFTNTSTNVPLGSTYAWDFNNDGVVDANGIGPHQFTYAVAGNYNAVLRIIEPNCVAQVSKVINVPVVSPPVINVAGNNTTICEGNTVQLTTNAASSYSWSTGGNTQQVNVGPGTYTVSVTYTNGCSATSAPVTISTAPASSVSITAGGPTTFCPGGSVQLTANPAGATYFWNTGQTSRNITASSAGTYTATITPAGACPGTASISVSTLPVPIVNAGADVTIALGQSTTLTATGAANYIWSPSATLNTSTNATVIATPTQTTLYSVQGTGANGCIGNDQVLVTVVQPTASFTGLLSSYCSNSQASTLVGTPSGGTFSGPGITGNTFNPANAGITGSASITYSVVNGLGETVSSMQTTTILQAPQASISIVGSGIVCAPNTITLTASGGSSYQWVGGPASQQFNVNSTGNYTVNVVNENGCQASASQSVTINPQPLANISADGPLNFCQGGQVILSANPGTSYLWSPGGQTLQSIVVTESGSYTVQVTNTFGCSNTSLPTVVNVTSGPVAPIIQVNGSNSICNGSSVTLSSNVSNVTWFRQGNGNAIGTGASIQVNQAGFYFARFESSCGIVNSNTVQINIDAAILPTFAAISPICAGSAPPTLPATSTNGITGSWSPATVSNTTTGTYTFTPNPGQCATTATLTVTVNQNLTPAFNAIAPICSGATAPVLPTTSTNGITGSWSPATVSNTTTGTYTFTPNPGQCATTATLTVTVNQNLTPAFNAIAPICSGATAPLLPTTSTNGITGSWSPATVSNTTTGTYTFTPNPGQCATAATLTVTVNPLPILVIVQSPICSIDLSTWSVIVSVSNGTLTSTAGSVTNQGNNQWLISAVPAGVSITLTANGDCPNTLNISAPNCDCPPVTAPLSNGNQNICLGSIIPALSVNVGAGETADWFDAAQGGNLLLSGSTSYVPTTAGTFHAQAKNISSGCVSSTRTAVSLTISANVTPAFNAIAPICSGSTAPVLPTTSTNGITGSWSPATVSNTTTGTYTFTPNPGQCATSATLTVTVNQNLTPAFNAIAPICSGATAPVLPTTSTNGITGSWSPATVSNTTTGTYTFTPNPGQCATTATLMVTVNQNLTPAFNAIAPICSGATAPILPTTSTNGITGSWSPATVSNTTTGTYTFTPNPGQCATTATLTVTVNPNISSTVNVAINTGESYTLPDGSVVSQAGQYVTVLQTQNGCANTITTNLTVISTPSGCFASIVIAEKTSQGNRKNGQPVLPIRSNTSEALGAPDPVINNVVNFYSLGFAGYITVKFDQPIANGPGNDIKIYEATWNNKTCNNYPERAEVFGSQDGCNFVYMGQVCHSGVVGIPAELQWIQYVQIRDFSNPAFFSANDDGYDVAGVECLHGTSTDLAHSGLIAGTLQAIPEYEPGSRKNGSPVLNNRRDKTQAIGMPGGSGINFVSLGFGGYLVGKFDFVVFNQDGFDLQLIETSFGNPSCVNYPEKAEISVSKDGIEFIPLSELCQDGAMELGSTTWIQYVKILDSSPLSSSRFNGAADGFDVDAVVDLHACSNGAAPRVVNTDNLSEPDVEWMANLYPNPTFGQANLELIDLPNNEAISIEIFDATGRMVWHQVFAVIDSQLNAQLELSNLSFGSYQIKVTTKAGQKVLKLMKQ